tara:strand:+ start:171 stop:803 length:633 start_codon:yes stop_codon:yes gene_type:complete
MTETVFKISRPFGPPLGLTEMPTSLISKINDFIDEEIKNKKIGAELDHGSKLVGQVKQEIKLPENLIEGELLNFFSALTKAYIKNAINKEVKNFRLIASWVIRQFENEYNPPHYHGGHVSGVGYLKLPETFGESIQESKKENSHGNINFIHGSKQFLSTGVVDQRPKLGDCYIFPNYMYHSVNPFFGKGERRSISFNAYIDEDIYNVYSL